MEEQAHLMLQAEVTSLIIVSLYSRVLRGILTRHAANPDEITL